MIKMSWKMISKTCVSSLHQPPQWGFRCALGPASRAMGLLILIAGITFGGRPLLAQVQPQPQPLVLVLPTEPGLDAEKLAEIRPLVMRGIDDSKMPGCVICVGRGGKIGYLESFGNKRLLPQPEAMTVDTVFDLASLTKPIATATSIMRLMDAGKITLQDHVVDHFPEFAPHGKDVITIQHLLVHQSGLIPDNALADYLEGEERAWQKICELKLVAPVGEVFKYSDVNFIILGKLVEKLSGKRLDAFVAEEIFQPLSMLETGFNPAAELRQRAAPTERRGGQWIQGHVHDPRAFALAGVAGHAGLFSTAKDLATYAQMMLDRGTPRQNVPTGLQILTPTTFDLMTADYQVSGGIRGLGWDKQTGFSSNRGTKLSEAAFGHGGFTGTVLWVDPMQDVFFIFLSNRVHPDGNGSVNRLAGAISDIIADALIDIPDANAASGVRLGIDVLHREQFSLLAGARVGLITNHTGRDSRGTSTVQLLRDAKHFDLRALFSPEHGFDGGLDVSQISNSRDRATGLTIYSLYGETRRPTAEMLAEIDTLVFDIQDIGTRFYTYVSTMGEAMRAAAEHDKRFVVLDRPNPIGGLQVAGPMLDAGKESFVGYHSLPVRHGMTIGELATMLNEELQLGLDLKVVKCEGWQRDASWDATGLTWINPSPNMRSLTQAFLYPGIGLLEMTNLSVGRGTDSPFEVIGAPWIEARALSSELRGMELPGVTFVPIEFTPTTSKFAGERCGGVNIIIIDRHQFEPLQTGLSIAAGLRRLYPNDWDTKNLNRLLGCEAVFESVIDGRPMKQVVESAGAGLDDFLTRRKQFLLY